jgi:hypothetical protein
MNNPEKELDERDWFAAHAPMAVISDNITPPHSIERLADAAFQYADAMMKRRMQK